MNKYKINSENWEKPHEIMATDDFVCEIFAALCDYYGIDTDEIHTEIDNRGVWRAYVKDDNGDFVIVLQRL